MDCVRSRQCRHDEGTNVDDHARNMKFTGARARSRGPIVALTVGDWRKSAPSLLLPRPAKC